MSYQGKLTNQFYQEALRSQAIVTRYRLFVTRSLPAMMAYLPGYDEKNGREVFEAIANNIEGETDIDTLTRELWELNEDGNGFSEEQTKFV